MKRISTNICRFCLAAVSVYLAGDHFMNTLGILYILSIISIGFVFFFNYIFIKYYSYPISHTPPCVCTVIRVRGTIPSDYPPHTHEKGVYSCVRHQDCAQPRLHATTTVHTQIHIYKH